MRSNQGWRIKAQRSWMSGDEEVFITFNDKIVRFTLEDWPDGAPARPTIGGYSVDGDNLHQAHFEQDGMLTFMRTALNAAWEMGLRPDGFDDTRESMKATNRHLEDMRSIAFGKLGVEKP